MLNGSLFFVEKRHVMDAASLRVDLMTSESSLQPQLAGCMGSFCPSVLSFSTPYDGIALMTGYIV
jgi:hypothetical protein